MKHLADLTEAAIRKLPAGARINALVAEALGAYMGQPSLNISTAKAATDSVGADYLKVTFDEERPKIDRWLCKLRMPGRQVLVWATAPTEELARCRAVLLAAKENP